ncbi:MAG: efflux RND transporter permease subunit [Ignavibacteriales bacterium]|nr:efflux RND transporter permease subunit [Ignavibacteriales bacterium]
MKITRTAIRRGVTTSMIYLIAVGFGMFSLARLNLDLYPKLEFPLIAIISQYTGVGPFDIETVVTRPIEKTVASVKNVTKVSSRSVQGLSLVMLEFDWGTNMDQAKVDVRDNLDFVRAVLPPDMDEPLLFAFDPSSQPVLYLAIQSDVHGQAELRRISERDIEPRMERIPGVAAAFTIGGMRREIKVLADPGRLHARGVSIDQIAAALRNNNTQVPSGWIEDERTEFTLQTAGEYTNLGEIENTVVTNANGAPIRVKDVATVVDGFADQRQRVWSNGRPAVMLMVQKQSDANTVEVSRTVAERIGEIEAQLPKGVRIVTFYDAASFITQSISNLGNTAIQAVLLTFLVLLFFLRSLRSSLIVAVSIPVSTVVTFAVMDQANLTLNIISMAGLALAVGMLVDNSIVVLESIFRHREAGTEIHEAANTGSTEVGMAITASTLTTLAVFIPVLFVPGLAGQLFREMVLTICFSLAVSLLVALTLIPFLTSRYLGKQDPASRIVFLHRIGELVSGWTVRLQSVYAIALRWSLHRRKLVILGITAVFILSIVILANLGGEFMPESDMGFISMAVDRTPGTSLAAMEQSNRVLNNILMADVPEAEIVFANFGQGEGIMAMFSSQSSSEGDITLRLSRRSERDRSMFEIRDTLRERFKVLPDVNVRFADRGGEMMMGTGGDIIVEIFGHDLDRAEALAAEVVKTVSPIEGVAHAESSIRQSRPELRIAPDRQRIADLGLSTSHVGHTIGSSILGTVATRYREGGDEYDVRVQLPQDARMTKEDIDNLLIQTMDGGQIPLRAVAEVSYVAAPRQISREDQERLVTVTIDVSGRDLSSVTGDVTEALTRVTVPNDFRVEIGGAAEEQQKSFMYLGLAMLAAILLTYMVMASQFESLLDPFIIIFIIPLSLIGVALALFITGTSLSVMALVGIVMLVGIVVNNGIVLVDYINQLRQRGTGLFEAIEEAGSVRMRPVLMTSMTTILAMAPLAFGLGESGENWGPMARAVMGGLAAGTVLTLIVIPVIYSVAEESVEKIRIRFRRAGHE